MAVRAEETTERIVVKEIPFDEYGYSGTGFDEVASALHNCSRATITRHRAGCGFPIPVFRILITTRVVNIRWVMAGALGRSRIAGPPTAHFTPTNG